jgi:hypothetical protein
MAWEVEYTDFVGGNATLSLATNHGAGLDVRGTSRVLAIASEQGPVSIEDNTGPGILVIDASIVFIGAVIQNNGPPDVNLIFGARANFIISTIAGTIMCDGTQLLQGGAC